MPFSALLGQRLAALGLCLSLGACATYERTKPAPAVAAPLSVTISSEQLSGWTDLPIGAYKVPDSDVIITGHQKGVALAGPLFGLIGLAVVHAANASSSAAGVANTEQAMRIKLNDVTRAEIERQIADASLADRYSMRPGGVQLDVSSGLLLSYVSDTQVRPYLILKATINGADRKPLWFTRYFASTGEAKALEGPGSWTADGGEPLRAALSINMRQAVKVMLTDIARPKARDDKQMTVVEGHLPFVRPRVAMLGYLVADDDRYIAFAPKMGDASALSGVSVMDKSVVVYRAAKPDEPVFRMLPEGAK